MVLLGPDKKFLSVTWVNNNQLGRVTINTPMPHLPKTVGDNWQHCNHGGEIAFTCSFSSVQWYTEPRDTNTMLSIAVVGHSLVPKSVDLGLDNVTVGIFRYPSAIIDSLNRNLDQSSFWNKTYDLVILCIGGNDLTNDQVSDVFDKFCNLVRRLLTQTSSLSACAVEYRLYHSDNRFGADRETFQRKVIKINPKIRRFLSNLGHRYLDLGKTDFTYNRTRDGVHFNSFAQAKL